MPVPNSIPTLHRHLRSGLAGLVLLLALPIFARGPEPALRLPLDKFGFQPLSPQFLLNGSSMLTLHYVDDKHLLLTFVVHRLIPRLPDEPEDDQDRVVDAVLLEVPSARILARTTWHLHDHAQYLWSLGHGHFLLRVRNTLTTFAPLANLSTSQPFAQQPFLTSPDRQFAALIVSPDADLLIIETIKRKPPAKRPTTPLFGPAPSPEPQLTERNRVQINFYRLHTGDDGGPVKRSFAGVVETRNTGDIPATTAGFLAIVDQGHQHWAFDFHSYAGKKAELSPFDSTCSPAPVFVSHSEFIAFGCRNGQTRQQLGGFNMRGEEMWEQGLFSDFIAPSLDFAPTRGRFALSRVLLHGSVIADQPISADEIIAQAVVVYQTDSGKQLLRADCSPVERAGQNFALSPNGLALAVVHADAIEIYNLPPLTDKDQAALKLAEASAPPENNLPIHFTDQPPPPSTDADSAERPGPQLEAPSAAANTATTNANPPSEATQPAAPTTAANTATTNANAPSDANQTPLFSQPDDPSAGPTPPPPAAHSTPVSQSTGDPAPEQHRARPTLYTLPGDKPPANPKDMPQ
jgi:hypothetical protein